MVPFSIIFVGEFCVTIYTLASVWSLLKRYPWLFPENMFQMIDAFHLRYALIPYIYNAARKNFDTGVAMCYPMYYDYPEAEESCFLSSTSRGRHLSSQMSSRLASRLM